MNIRYATAYDLDNIKQLMKANKDYLGFIPIGPPGSKGFNALIDRAQVIVAYSAILAGYLAWTRPDHSSIRIHQLVVHESLRKRGIGKRLLTELLILEDLADRVYAEVRADIPANAFWWACGFRPVHWRRHPSSHSVILTYERSL
jgi:ribosomal protein S18 acetylase RimI-like enzyme